MSHYGIIVFKNKNQSFDELLAPYSEINKNYYKFFPCEKTEAELLKEYNEFLKRNPGWEKYGFGYYLKEAENYIFENGSMGRSYNPNGYYDYYTLDGRYQFPEKKRLFKKNNCSMRLKDYIYLCEDSHDWYNNPSWYCDFITAIKIIRNNYKISKETWNEIMSEPDVFNDGTENKRKKYHLERYGTEKQYIKEYVTPWPIAFVTPDGVWHSPGRVGWFATDDFTADAVNKHIKEWKRFIHNPKNRNLYISQVDCHI